MKLFICWGGWEVGEECVGGWFTSFSPNIPHYDVVFDTAKANFGKQEIAAPFPKPKFSNLLNHNLSIDLGRSFPHIPRLQVNGGLDHARVEFSIFWMLVYKTNQPYFLMVYTLKLRHKILKILQWNRLSNDSWFHLRFEHFAKSFLSPIRRVLTVLRGSDCKYRESLDKLKKSKILITCQKNTFGELSSKI